MAGVGRVGDGEYAARVNAAVELARGGDRTGGGRAGAGRPVRCFGAPGPPLRRRRRYGRVEIPDRAVAFTVKLPEGLVGRVRAYAAEHRLAISAVVAAALVEFLARDRGGRPDR